jgi:hypothetical protein
MASAVSPAYVWMSHLPLRHGRTAVGELKDDHIPHTNEREVHGIGKKEHSPHSNFRTVEWHTAAYLRVNRSAQSKGILMVLRVE